MAKLLACFVEQTGAKCNGYDAKPPHRSTLFWANHAGTKLTTARRVNGQHFSKTQNQQALMNYPNANSLKMGGFCAAHLHSRHQLTSRFAELQALPEVQELSWK